jgi:hypothetical protein
VARSSTIFKAAEKRRLRPGDLLARFEEVRRAEQLDESAAEMLMEQYIQALSPRVDGVTKFSPYNY